MKLNWNIAVGLQILLENNGSLTFKEIAKNLGISKTQAYDLLTACRYYLKEKGISVFCPKKKGVLQLDADAQKQLKDLLYDIASLEREFPPAGRRRYLFFELWHTPYLKNHQICAALDVSRNTCINDIMGLSEELQQAGFDVRVNSSVNGYTLSGNEADLRKALVWELSYVGCWTHPGERYPLSSRIEYAYYGLPYEEICNMAENLVSTATHMNIFLSEQSCFLIAAVFLLWMDRWKRGKYLCSTDVDEALTRLHGREKIYWLLQDTGVKPLMELLRKDSRLQVAERSEIIKAETEELIRTIICIASIYEEYPEPLFYSDPKLEDEVSAIVPAFERAGGNKFPHRTLVAQNARQYIRGALSRVAFGYSFYRAEDALINREYCYLLELTRSVVSGIPVLESHLNENELVALTLQYIGWMSVDEKENEESALDMPRIGIVCANAVGVGGLLRTQIHHFFPEASTCLIPLAQLKSKKAKADLFISTLALDTEVPCLRVSALLTTHDRYRIQKQINQYLGQTGHNAELLCDIQQIVRDFVEEEHMPLLNARLEQLLANKKIKILKERSTMLTDLITQKRIQCIERVSDWREAIRTASVPLLEDGSIQESYVDAMVESVETIGPYIVLAPGIALPHARPEAGVERLAMALLRTQEPVYFDDTKYANLFFVLASSDGKSHMTALIQLSHIFGSEGIFERFMAADGPAELWALLNERE